MTLFDAVDQRSSTSVVDHDELPEGWERVRLSDVVELNPAKPAPDVLAPTAEVSFVPMPAVDADAGAIVKPQRRPFAEVRKGFTAFRDGDVILAKITPCFENGKAAIVRDMANGLGFGSTEFHVLRPTSAVFANYVYHFIRQESFRRGGESEMTGSVGQKRVPADFVRDNLIPLPPLAEQKRIAAKVDTLLAKVRAASNRLATVPALLTRFRRSVLAAACTGRLTADWRTAQADSESAGAFIAKIHAQRLNATGPQVMRKRLREPVCLSEVAELPASWCETRIGDVADCLDHLRVPINKDARKNRLGDVPYYGANGQVGWIDKHLFDEDLVLVVEDESFVGREKPFSYVIRGKSWVNNHAHVLRPLGAMSADYLNVLLAYYDFVPLTSGTTGRRKLNQAALLDAPICIAPLAEQHEIVRRVEALFVLADAAEQRAAAAAARVGRITQAVLAKAFRGELLETEAALARRERRDYEPASVLLERIRVERSNGARSTTRRQSKR